MPPSISLGQTAAASRLADPANPYTRSMGLIYFVHEFKPRFNEHALLDDAEMLRAVTAVNRQIHSLAPVLNSPSVPDLVSVASSQPEAPIDIMVKRHAGRIHIFAVAMRDGRTTATFTIRGQGRRMVRKGAPDGRAIEDIETLAGRFADEFGPWDVRLYSTPDESAGR